MSTGYVNGKYLLGCFNIINYYFVLINYIRYHAETLLSHIRRKSLNYAQFQTDQMRIGG